jgi:hypothetical protein
MIDLGSEGTVDLGDLPISDDASAIALAQLPEPPSGQSLTSWTDVIRRQRAAQNADPAASPPPAAQPVEVDAASDKDLLELLLSGEGSGAMARVGLPRSGDTSEIPQAEIPVYKPAPSESDIDLGRPVPNATAGSEVGFDIQYPPSDAGGVMPLAALPLSEPELDLGAFSGGSGSATGISGIDLGAEDSPESTPGRSSILDVLLRESGGVVPPQTDPSSGLLDFGDAPVVRSSRPTMPTTGTSPSRASGNPTQPGIDLAADGSAPADSALDLTGPDSAHGSDEAVDLYAEGGSQPNISDSGSLEISEEAFEESIRRAEILDSSSVDLSSRPSYSGSEFDVGLGGNSNGPDDDEVDLALPPSRDEANSSMFHRRAEVEDTEAAVAAEFANRRRRREAEEKANPKTRRDEIVPGREERGGKGKMGAVLAGSVIGLLLGAGGVLGAYFGGMLPGRSTESTSTDNSAAVAQLKQDADTAKKQAADAATREAAAREQQAKAEADVGKSAETIKTLTDEKSASDLKASQLADAAVKDKEALTAAKKAETDAKTAEEIAKKALGDAEKATAEAKKQLIDATKAVDVAKAETVATKKAADEAMDAIAKLLKGAGIDPAKPDDGLKKLIDAKTTAETKEKDLTTKLGEAAKKETEFAKQMETAKKLADDATKARQASETLLATVGERLAKAKFVGEKPDGAAIVKGLDDAVKAATTDATATLREELTKARAAEAKMKTDLADARVRETQATKVAEVAKLEALKLQELAKATEIKLTADAAKYKADAEKLAKDASDASAKAVAAEKLAVQAKAAAEMLAGESTKLKTENERLARDLEAVRELAALIKTPAAATSPTAKPDPVKLADRFFVDGMRAFYAGEYPAAESAFRKAIQFRADDARYHYLLGLALWMNKDSKGAESAFEKGRDLESESRPSSRVVSAVLERIQGPARQAVNAYRP